MSVEWNLILDRFEKHVRALRTLVNANVEQKVTLTDAMARIRELLESARSIDCLGYSIKISKLVRELQRLSGLVDSKDLEVRTMLWLVDKASSLRAEALKLKEEWDQLTAENNVVLALGTEIFELKSMIGSIVGFRQEVNARAVETEGDLKKAQDAIPVSGSCKKALVGKVSSLTEELASVRLERAIVSDELDEMATLVQRVKEGVVKLLSTVTTEVRTIWLMLLNGKFKRIS